MKNIHLIKTDKPSRLHLWTDENGTRPALCELEYSHTRNTQNIYITSSEEIKEGDWVIYLNKPSKVETSVTIEYAKTYCKKIILTTDSRLIKDGVQAISNEFLEWFVKNPSCEFADVNDWLDDNGNIAFGGNTRYQLCNHLYNKESIPKEETTAYHYLSCCRSIEECHCGKYPKQIKCYCGHTTMCDCSPIDEPKQETLEEAAENYGNSIGNKNGTAQFDFIRGAKWQQERMYSEAFGIIYVLETLLDFAGEDNATSISISTTDAEKIIKLLKQIK